MLTLILQTLCAEYLTSASSSTQAISQIQHLLAFSKSTISSPKYDLEGLLKLSLTHANL